MKRFMFEALAALKGIAIMAVTLSILFGVVWGITERFPVEEHIPDAASDTCPVPPSGFKAENWFAYVRQHRDIPSEFFNVSADKEGIVWIQWEACLRLKELTGGLPEEHFLGYLDENRIYWVFDFNQDKYVRYEE